MIKSRADAKLNQSRCFGALQRYMIYGSDFIRRTTLTDPALQGLTSEQLLAKIGDLMGKQHEVLYYGPQDEAEVKAALAAHHKVAADLQPLEKKFSTLQPTVKTRSCLPSTTPSSSTTCSIRTAARNSTSQPTRRSPSTTSISAEA